MARVSKMDAEVLRRLWDADVPTSVMAAHFKVRPEAVTRAAARQNLTSRQSGAGGSPCADRFVPSREIADLLGLPQRVDAGKARPVPVLPYRGPWTPDRDARLYRAAGRYAAMQSLAGQWGLGFQSVLARWHQLRAVAS